MLAKPGGRLGSDLRLAGAGTSGKESRLPALLQKLGYCGRANAEPALRRAPWYRGGIISIAATGGGMASVDVEEAAQLFAAAGVAQFAQGLGFDLADAFAGDVELLADFFQRVIRVHVDAEAHAQHALFARRQ